MAPASEEVLGTCFVVSASMIFAVVAMIVGESPMALLPATQCRFMVSWLVAIIFMLLYRQSEGLRWFGPPELRCLLLLKCVCSVSFTLLWWTALRMVPIGDCIAIIYSSPILTSLLSWWLLGETLPSEFPLQVFLVLSGNMLIVDPPFVHGLPTFTSSDSSIAYLVLFIALALAAVLPVVTAKTKACSWIEVEHVGAAVASAVLIPGLMFADYAVYGAVPSIPTESPLDAVNIILAALGTFGGVALETKGYQLASAGRASMFRNLEVPFAYALQRWSTVTPVAPRALLGALLIVMSCGIGGITSRFWQSSETQQLSSKVGLEGIESDEVPLVDATLKV